MTRQSPISSRASIAASAKPTIPSALKANAEVESFIDNAEGVRESTPKAFPINAEGVPISAEGVPDQRRRRPGSAPKAFVDPTPKAFVDQRRRRSSINAEGV